MAKHRLNATGAVVITGAASGMGAACARLLVQKNANLALIDLNEDGLKKVAAEILESIGTETISLTTHVADVTNAFAMTQVAEEIKRIHGNTHTLINCAGSSMLGSFAELTLDEFAWLMNINLWGTITPCKVFLEQLLESPHGHITNLASAYALIAPAGRVPYSTSKYAVRGFSESLRHELAGTSVSVCTVFPGGIQTGLVARARVASAADPQVIERVTQAQLAEYGTSAETAAKKIVRATEKRKARLLIGKDAKGLDILSRIFAGSYWSILNKRLAAATETNYPRI